ncbi:hypothetical protein HK101_000345 [Irineochytrium annulatum]|nr:hypothetical protein HK101_000345 [Irineochytrium annulatum]
MHAAGGPSGGAASQPSASIADYQFQFKTEPSAGPASFGDGGGGKKRASRACEPCRKKRIKCSGEQPCASCRQTPKECTAPLKRKPNVFRRTKMAMLERRVESIESVLERLSPGSTFAIMEADSHRDASSKRQRLGDYPNLPFKREIGVSSQQKFAGGVTTSISQANGHPNVDASNPHRQSHLASIEVTNRQSPVPNPPTNSSTISGHTGFQPATGSMLTDPENTFFTYYGHTSALGGDAVYRSSARFSNGVFIASERIRKPVTRGIRVPLATIIPCPVVFLSPLVFFYFLQFHPVFPMIDKSDFLSNLEAAFATQSIDPDANWAFLLLLLSLITIMLQFTPSLQRWAISESPEHLASGVLMKRAELIINEHLGSSHVMAVQAMLLLAMSSAGRRGRGTLMWTFCGMAVRKAQEMGLHRNLALASIAHPKLTEDVMETRRRTWFCVLIADTYISGRPTAIHPTDWDANLPQVHSEDNLTLARHVELANIFATISKFANRAQPLDDGAFVRDVHARLAKWESDHVLPISAAATSNAPTSPVTLPRTNYQPAPFTRWGTRAFMTLMFHSATILFHRTAFSRLSDPPCLASARGIVHLLSLLPRIDLDSDACCVIFPTVNYGIMIGMTVWLARVTQPFPTAQGPPGTAAAAAGLSPEEERREAEEVRKALLNVQACINAVDNLRGLSIQAMRVWRTVNEYLTSKGITLPGGVPGAPLQAHSTIHPHAKVSNIVPTQQQSRSGPVGVVLQPQFAGAGCSYPPSTVGSNQLHWDGFAGISSVGGVPGQSAVGGSAPIGDFLGGEEGWLDGIDLFDMAAFSIPGFGMDHGQPPGRLLGQPRSHGQPGNNVQQQQNGFWG